MKPKIFIAVVPLSLAMSNPALAHHSFSAQFDVDKPLAVTGTVTKIEWRNPHTWFFVDVDDGSGNVANWAIELASPNLLMRSGWSRDSLKVGDVVSIEGYLAKDGTHTANAKSLTLTATGQTVLTGRNVGSGK